MPRLFESVDDGTWQRLHQAVAGQADPTDDTKMRSRSPRQRREDRALAEFAAAVRAAEIKAARISDRTGTGDTVLDVDDL